MKDYLASKNETLETKTSITWFTHQDCKDMFLLSKWNQSKTYEYAIVRDFGTDYGICCWYTPQLNYTEIDLHTRQNNLSEPDWEFWFDEKVPKVEQFSPFPLSLTQSAELFRVPRRVKTTGSRCCLTLSPLTTHTSTRGRRD